MATFIVEIDSPLSRDEVRREVLIRFSIPLGNADYGVESQNEVVITYARRHRPSTYPRSSCSGSYSRFSCCSSSAPTE